MQTISTLSCVTMVGLAILASHIQLTHSHRYKNNYPFNC